MEFEKLQQIIAEVLNVDADEISMETTFVDDLGADSLDIFQIIMGIEEEFDAVSLPGGVDRTLAPSAVGDVDGDCQLLRIRGDAEAAALQRNAFPLAQIPGGCKRKRMAFHTLSIRQQNGDLLLLCGHREKEDLPFLRGNCDLSKRGRSPEPDHPLDRTGCPVLQFDGESLLSIFGTSPHSGDHAGAFRMKRNRFQGAGEIISGQIAGIGRKSERLIRRERVAEQVVCADGGRGEIHLECFSLVDRPDGGDLLPVARPVEESVDAGENVELLQRLCPFEETGERVSGDEVGVRDHLGHRPVIRIAEMRTQIVVKILIAVHRRPGPDLVQAGIFRFRATPSAKSCNKTFLSITHQIIAFFP